MTACIALLRGINVGGKHKIKMADLKTLFERLGYCDVQTVIQSGNVVFQGQDVSADVIETAIREAYGFDVPVVLRTGEAFKAVAATCPFTEASVKAADASGKESLYVAFFNRILTSEDAALLAPYESDSERFVIAGDTVYLLFSDSIRNAKLATKLNKIDGIHTVRNWKTVGQLVERLPKV
ncbi:DUF1697 domain-containing protein [Fusibacter sp. JL298sf-3]